MEKTMLLTLAMVIFFASIAVFFSQEFIRGIKKIFAIKGAILFIPLLIASWLIYTFQYWALWGVFYYREVLQTMLSFLIHIMPFKQAARPLSLILLLTFISVVPVLVIDLLMVKRTYLHYKYPYVTSALIWLISAVLLLAV